MIPARQLIKILQNKTNILTAKKKNTRNRSQCIFIDMIKYAYNSDLLVNNWKPTNYSTIGNKLSCKNRM